MLKFKAINRKNQVNEFCYMISPGGGDVMTPDAKNIQGDEITIVPADDSKKGSYTMVLMESGDEMQIIKPNS